MKLGRSLALGAVLIMPLALLSAPAAGAAAAPTAGATVPSVTINFDPSICSWDASLGYKVCDVPTGDPLVTPGTTITLVGTTMWYANHMVAWSTTLTTADGASEAIPAAGFNTESEPDSYRTMTVTIPDALSYAVGQGITSGYQTIEVQAGTEAPGEIETAIRLPVDLQRPPSAPTAVTGKRSTSTSAAIAWQLPAVNDGGTSYFVVRRSSSAGNWSTKVSGSARSFTFTSLTGGSGYLLSVQAVNAAVGSGPLAQVGVPGNTGSLNAPSATTVKRTGDSTATISWKPPTSLGGKTITGYRVARDGHDAYGGGLYSKVIPAGARSFTMHYLVLGSTYTLSVQPVYSGGSGPKSQGAVYIG